MEKEYKLSKYIEELEVDCSRYTKLMLRAVREFMDYASAEEIVTAVKEVSLKDLSELSNVRYLLIERGSKFIPFKSYRRDNDPGRED